MEIGIDDFDEFDDLSGNSEQIQNQEVETQLSENNTDDVLEQLLKSKGIEDSSKIKFEKDDGEIEEVDWNTLSNEDKLNILRTESTHNDNFNDLDETEIQLLNTIRNSKMSPQEYINYVQNTGVQQYLQNVQSNQYSYQIDDISDDELFLADLISKIGEDNISEQELQNILETAKSNESVFKKQVDAIRNEYRQIEYNNIQQEAEVQRQTQVEQYNAFAESIENEIRSFTDFCGYELNMDESEMEELYDLITGFDKAGVSVFGKLLNDPPTLVRMGWFALNGEKAIQDINDYWTNEIKNVRKTSYEQGLKDAKNNKINQYNVEIKPKSKSKSNIDLDDLDDF